jgi:hypothetical protein
MYIIHMSMVLECTVEPNSGGTLTKRNTTSNSVPPSTLGSKAATFSLLLSEDQLFALLFLAVISENLDEKREISVKTKILNKSLGITEFFPLYQSVTACGVTRQRAPVISDFLQNVRDNYGSFTGLPVFCRLGRQPAGLCYYYWCYNIERAIYRNYTTSFVHVSNRTWPK